MKPREEAPEVCSLGQQEQEGVMRPVVIASGLTGHGTRRMVGAAPKGNRRRLRAVTVADLTADGGLMLAALRPRVNAHGVCVFSPRGSRPRSSQADGLAERAGTGASSGA